MSGRAHYEVVRLLGEGGVGRVYEAVYGATGRRVAIKTLRSEHADPSSQRLLLNEAAAAAQLSHPGVVQLFDVGRDERGSLFLVMELVTGHSLDAWSNTPPRFEALHRTFAEILNALSAAHAQGIVHGDLKPGNVLLGEDGRAKLTDFGIAHMIDPLRDGVRRGVQGTPYYMAPEQLADVEAIAPPTDLYAVGVMLYELLSGQEPYPSTGTLAEMLARKLYGVARFSPRRGLEVPEALRALVLGLLHPDPRLRPRFAADVLRRLDACASAVRQEDAADAMATGPQPAATIVDSALGTAPTITSSEQLPITGGSMRSLPFSLPSVAGHEPDVALHRLRPLPLVGRQDQVTRLIGMAESVARRGGVRALLVSGRAGEGKTRLLRHGFAEVERRGLMLVAAASFDETIASGHVDLRACALRLLGAPARGATLDDTFTSRWTWLRTVEQPGVDFERLHAWLLPGARPLDAATTAELCAVAVTAASRVIPVYLWLDDVAWSKDGAMALVVALLERNEGRVLVVGSLRSGTAEHPAVRQWLDQVAALRGSVVTLPPLSTADRVALLAAAGPLEATLAEQLGERLDEPTLVLVEAVRDWIDQGALAPSERGFVLAEQTSVDDLVAGARGALLSRRLDVLLSAFGAEAAAAERVLGHAALLGLRFEERVLRHCVADQASVDRLLDRALLSGLLRVDGRGAYRFEHRMFVDAIVKRAARRSDASEILASTGRALLDVYGMRNADTTLGAAELLRRGGDHEGAFEAVWGAVRALARANIFDRADAALAMFRRWLDEDGRPEGSLEHGLYERAVGMREYYALRYPQAREHLARARALFARHGDHEKADALAMEISSTYFYEDDFATCERWVASVKEGRFDAVFERSRHRMAELAALRRDLPRAVALQTDAAKNATSADDAYHIVITVGTLAELLVTSGDLEGAEREVERMHALTHERTNRFMALDMARTRALVQLGRGEWYAARELLRPRIASLTARNDAWHLTADLAAMAVVSAAVDPAPAAEQAVRAFIESYRAVKHDESSTWWCFRMAESLLRGRQMSSLADELAALLDRRFAEVDAAFSATPSRLP